MIIKSMAGDFEIEISGFETDGGHLVMVGRMGVWDARTYINAREFLGILLKLLSPTVVLYALRAPFLALAVQKKPGEADTSETGRQ